MSLLVCLCLSRWVVYGAVSKMSVGHLECLKLFAKGHFGDMKYTRKDF